MELPESLINEFANVVSPRVDRTNNETVVYGTVKTVDGKTAMVQLDGSDAVTPCVMSMTAEQNDRVRVAIKDHKAVVTGNVTAPATASSADKYMRFTDEGLVIGGLDKDGKPSGFYVLISNDTYYIKDQSGATIAKFASNEVNLASGEATIKSENETLYLIGKNAVGLRSVGPDGHGGKFAAEVVSGIFKDSSGYTVPRSALQTAWYQKTSDTTPSRTSAIIANETTVDVMSPSGLLVNGVKVAGAGGLLTTGRAIARNVTIPANYGTPIQINSLAEREIIPEDYMAVGLTGFVVSNSNGAYPDPLVSVRAYRFGYDGTVEAPNKVWIYLYNERSSSVTVDVEFTVYALPYSYTRSTGTKYIDF